MASLLSAVAVTVTTGATRIFSSNNDAQYRAVQSGASTLYIGGAGVTTAQGYILTANTSIFFVAGDDRDSGMVAGEIWGMVTTGTNTTRTLEAQ
jgi:hypothetical protein